MDQPPKGYWEDVRRQLGNRPIPSDIDLTLVFAVSRSVQSVTLYFTVTTHTRLYCDIANIFIRFNLTYFPKKERKKKISPNSCVYLIPILFLFLLFKYTHTHTDPPSRHRLLSLLHIPLMTRSSYTVYITSTIYIL